MIYYIVNFDPSKEKRTLEKLSSVTRRDRSRIKREGRRIKQENE